MRRLGGLNTCRLNPGRGINVNRILQQLSARDKPILRDVGGVFGEGGNAGNSGAAIGFVVGALESEGSGFFGGHVKRKEGRVERSGRLLPREKPLTQVVIGRGWVTIY